MKKLIYSLPLPSAGLMLGLAAAGNLVSSHGNVFRIIFGTLSAMLMALLIFKMIFAARAVLEDLKNPAIAGIAAAFPMGVMVLSSYIEPYSHWTGYGMWLIGILVQSIFLVCFTKRFILNFNIQKVFPSYFVVYVGLAAAALAAPLFGAAEAGRVFFWFGFITYLIFLPVIAYRVFVVKSLPEPFMPTITIFAAPPALCLVGYLNTFQEINMTVIWLLALLSLTTLFAVLLYMPRMLKLKFYPSYAAFTFPIVISATAVKNIDIFLKNEQMGMSALGYLACFLELLAVALVIYVLIRYTVFMRNMLMIKRAGSVAANT